MNNMKLMRIIQKDIYIIKFSIIRMQHSQYKKYFTNYYILKIKQFAILYVFKENISHKLSSFNKILNEMNKDKTTSKKYRYIPYQEATVNPKITNNAIKEELTKILQATGLKDFYTFTPITNDDHIQNNNKSIYTQYYGSCLNILNFHKQLCARSDSEHLCLRQMFRYKRFNLKKKQDYTFNILNKITIFITTSIPLNDIKNITNNNKFQHDPALVEKINCLIIYFDSLLKKLKRTKKNNKINFYTQSINELNSDFYDFFFETFETKNSKEEILENYAVLFPLLTKYKLTCNLLYFKLYYCYFHLLNENNSLDHKMAWIMSYFHEYCINDDDNNRKLFIKNFRDIKRYLYTQDQLFLLSFIINLKLYRLLYNQGYRVSYDDNNYHVNIYDPYNSHQYANILYRRELKKYLPKFYYIPEKLL